MVGLIGIAQRPRSSASASKVIGRLSGSVAVVVALVVVALVVAVVVAVAADVVAASAAGIAFVGPEVLRRSLATIATDRPPLRNREAVQCRVRGRRKIPALEPFAFRAEETDHCETPTNAYRDVAGILGEIGQVLRPEEPWKQACANLQIYDPYYCQGGTKRRLGKLGFDHVHNENEDFYVVAKSENVTAFDVLVTNPPFSDAEHVTFALDFAISSGKPWLMILPVSFIFSDIFTRVEQVLGADGLRPFYVVPGKKYNFKTPAPLPPPPKIDRHHQARTRSRISHTLWVVQGGADKELHQRLLEVARSSFDEEGVEWAESVSELPKSALPGHFTKDMKRVAELQGLVLSD